MMVDKKKLHICIIPAWYPTYTSIVDGIFVQEQAILLARAGFTVSVLFIANHINEEETGYQLSNGVHEFRASTRRIPKLNSWLIDQWARKYSVLFDKLVDKVGRPDIFHAHSYIGGFSAARLSTQNNIPYVITEHSTNLINDYLFPWHKNEIKKTYDGAITTIAVGEALANKMSRFSDQRIHVVPNTFDPDIFKFDDSIRRKKVFLVVGGLIGRKRVLTILDQFIKAKLANFELHFIGAGSLKNKLQKKVDRNSANDSVKFLGPLKPNEIAKKMQASAGLITCSDTETFGKVIIESMACGTPVVATKSADPESIVSQESGVRIQSISELSSILKAFSQRTFNHKEISKSTLKKYGPESVIQALEKIYYDVLP